MNHAQRRATGRHDRAVTALGWRQARGRRLARGQSRIRAENSPHRVASSFRRRADLTFSTTHLIVRSRHSRCQAAFSVAAAGGPGTFNVIQQSDPNTCGGATQDRCLWTATADVPWITVTGSMPRSGDNPVAFTVAANDGTAVRVGRIHVRDKVVAITQAGK